MTKKGKSHRMSGPRKWAKRGIGYVRLAVGVLGFGGPTIRAVVGHVGDPQNLPAAVIYENTGVDGTGAFDQGKAIATGTQFVATAVLLAILTWAGRHV